MILQRLIINNFRPFFGEQMIYFADEEGKNITLIHAENGVGKSAILSAILWCLYARVISELEQPDDLLNHEAADNGIGEFSVTLDFKYENKEFSITRKGFPSGNKARVFEIVGGNYKPIPSTINFVNSVIPSSMADYFFFHGEGNLSSEGKDIRRAIRDILGFSLAETALSDLQHFETQLRREIRKLSNNKGLNEIQDQVLEYEDKLIDANEEIDKLEPRISRLRDIINSHQELLRSKPNVREIQERREREEAKLSIAKTRLKKAKQDEIKFISHYGWAVMAKKLATESTEFIDKSEIEEKIPSPFNEIFIEGLLKDEKCICGTTLPHGSVAYNLVRERLAESGNHTLNSRVSGAKARIRTINVLLSEATKSWLAVQKELRIYQRAVKEIETEITELTNQITSINEAEILKIEKELHESTNDYERLRDKLTLLKRDREGYKARLESLKIDEKRAISQDVGLKAQQSHFHYVQSLVNLLSEELDGVEKKAANQIELKVNETLEEISRKDYSAVLDERSFSLNYKKTDGRIVGASKGERLLLNFAFISSLIEYCRTRSNEESQIFIPGAIAPLVIDAPFGDLDDTYKAETAKFLPKKASQVVLLLSSSHWKGTIEAAISDSIGSEYVLISERKDTSQNRPLDSLFIRGREVEQSKYSCDKDMTKVLEVDW